MKKLLVLLGIINISITPTLTVISCNAKLTPKPRTEEQEEDLLIINLAPIILTGDNDNNITDAEILNKIDLEIINHFKKHKVEQDYNISQYNVSKIKRGSDKHLLAQTVSIKPILQPEDVPFKFELNIKKDFHFLVAGKTSADFFGSRKQSLDFKEKVLKAIKYWAPTAKEYSEVETIDDGDSKVPKYIIDYRVIHNKGNKVYSDKWIIVFAYNSNLLVGPEISFNV